MTNDKKIPKELKMIKGDTWNEYIADLSIPKEWINVSYGNDALPSFMTEENQIKAYHVWIDSWSEKERALNSKDIWGYKDKLAERFQVCLCYGSEESDLFMSNDFDEVVEWINKNPKTKEQIKLTKKYI
tara:strand:- start:132 stop:518 length:387 start_codon:yes stop_codon:yes gene_type:complete